MNDCEGFPHLETLALVERLQAENAALRAEVDALRQRGNSPARIWHVTDAGRAALAAELLRDDSDEP